MLQASYKVRPHRRRSFDPTDSMGLAKVTGYHACLVYIQSSVTFICEWLCVWVWVWVWVWVCICVSTHSLSMQHCLAGWENAQPSVIPPQSKVDLKSAVKPTVSSALSLSLSSMHVPKGYWPNMAWVPQLTFLCSEITGQGQNLWCGYGPLHCKLHPPDTPYIPVARMGEVHSIIMNPSILCQRLLDTCWNQMAWD